MLFQIQRGKLLQQFSPHPMDQQVSSCYHSFLTVTQSYHSQVTPIGAFHAEQIYEAVLLYVFRIAFTASLLTDPVQPGLFYKHLCNSFSQSVIHCEKIFKTIRAEQLIFLENVHPPPCFTCHIPDVTCHVSHVTCLMSRDTCHVSHVT